MPEAQAPVGARVVGVLGGMGPSATVDFYAKLVRHTPALRDQDHLPIVIWADPTVPNRQDALLAGGADPTPWLEEGVHRLLVAGAQIVVVPCNTIHAYLGPVMADQSVEFISIIDTTVEAIRFRGSRKVGLLATDGALASGIFQSAFDASGVECVLPRPEQQQRLMRLVDAVKAGPVEHRMRAQVEEMLADLREQGGVTTVAGCTEISTLLSDVDGEDVDVIDPALELALRTIERATRS